MRVTQSTDQMVWIVDARCQVEPYDPSALPYDTTHIPAKVVVRAARGDGLWQETRTSRPVLVPVDQCRALTHWEVYGTWSARSG